MDRKEFLSAIGFSAAGIALASCVASCKKESAEGTPPASGVDFTLDLTQAGNAALATAGGFIYKDGVIVAKTTAGTYIAVAQACTHTGTSVEFQGGPNRFFCPNHGAIFATSGAVTSGPAPSPLKQYTTTLTGNSLRVNG